MRTAEAEAAPGAPGSAQDVLTRERLTTEQEAEQRECTERAKALTEEYKRTKDPNLIPRIQTLRAAAQPKRAAASPSASGNVPPSKLLIAAILLFIAFGLIISRYKTSQPPVTASYLVTGSSQSVDLTYKNGTGGTDQTTVSLPWNRDLPSVRSGQFLYISAQNKDEFGGPIHVAIEVGGKPIKEADADTQYGIASVSATAP